MKAIISIHEFKTKKLKNYYNATKKVYRQHHVDELIQMWKDLIYLDETHTRTMLVPYNEEFLQKKAIPIYNDTVKRLQAKYPYIKEFQRYKPI